MKRHGNCLTFVAEPKSEAPSLTFRLGTSIFSRMGFPEAGQTVLPCEIQACEWP